MPKRISHNEASLTPLKQVIDTRLRSLFTESLHPARLRIEEVAKLLNASLDVARHFDHLGLLPRCGNPQPKASKYYDRNKLFIKMEDAQWLTDVTNAEYQYNLARNPKKSKPTQDLQ